MAMSAMNSNSTSPVNIVSDSFSISLYSNNNAADQEALAVRMNLPTIDNSGCEDLIRKKYNITRHLFIQKVDYSEKLNNASSSLNKNNTDMVSAGSSVSFRMFNPYTKQEYNVSQECANVSVAIKIPLPTKTMINPKLARKFQSTGVNIVNQSDQFYVDRCKIYINESTGILLTLGERKTNFYPNQTSACSPGCSFEGFDTNNYMICNCKKSTSLTANVMKSALEAFTSLNFDVVLCLMSVAKNVSFSLFFRTTS